MSSVLRRLQACFRLRAFRILAGGVSLSASLLISGCGIEPTSVAKAGQGLSIAGSIHGGQQPVGGALLQMYAVGTTGDGSAATPILTAHLTTSDGTGNAGNANANAGNGFNSLPTGAFIIGDYVCPTPSTQVYLVATGGNPGLAAGTVNPALAMLTVLGACGNLSNTTVQINEITAVGSLAPLAPYANGYAALGSGSNDASQFLAALNLVQSYTDITQGTAPGPGLASGYYASTTEITTLADILAACINSDGTGVCQQLFTLTTPPGGTAPTDTVGAMLNILKYPANNTAAIFGLLPPNSPFQPALATAPASWTLPILPYAATPVIAPPSGTYSSSPDITITTSTPGATIYYTVDGGVPTTASTVYTAPFPLSTSSLTTRTVQAIAVANGYMTSAVARNTYSIPNAGIVQGLKFFSQPTDTVVGQPIPDFNVGFVDSYGNQVLVNNTGVNLALGTNPGGATLSGTTTFGTSTRGYAIAGGLSLNKAANGYTLTASSSGYPTITSSTFNIKPQPITFSLLSPLIGPGRTLTGTFTLPSAAPAGGASVALTSSDSTIVTVAPATVTVAAGATTGTFTYTAVGSGSVTLTASATSYGDGTTSVATSTNVLTLGTFPTAPNNTATPVSVTLSNTVATATTVTLTSSSTATGTITSPVAIPAGATSPTTQPSFTGKSYGVTTVTAIAPGFAPDSRVVTLAGTATLTQNLTAARSSTATATITLGATSSTNTVFTLTSDNTAVATVPATVTVNAGSTSATFQVASAGVGTANIRAKSAGFADLTSTMSVTGTVLGVTSVPVIGMIAPASVTLTYAAVTPIAVTLTSNNPAILLASTPNGAASTSVTLTNVTGSTIAFYTNSPSAGSANITVTSPSLTTYTSNTVTTRAPEVSFQFPDGFLTQTTTLNGKQTAYASLGYSNSGTFVPCQSIVTSVVVCQLPLGTTVTTGLTSANTSVETIDVSSVTFTNSIYNNAFGVTPVGSGNTTLTYGTLPTNYVAGNNVLYVSTPGFTIPISQLLGGTGLTVSTGSTSKLNQTDQRIGGATVTISVANSSIATLSLDPAVVGTSSLTLTGITSALPAVYVQGQGVGQTQVNYSSPGYVTQPFTLNVYAGTVLLSGGSTVSTSATDTTVTLTLSFNGSSYPCLSGTTVVCFLNPGLSNSFNIVSSNTAVGAVTGPVVITAGTAAGTTTFRGATAGATTLTPATPPAPLVAPVAGTSGASLAETVTQSTITASAVSTGALLQVTSGFSLSPATAGRTVTITSSNPAVAVLSASSTTAGAASLTLTSTTGTVAYYVQGIAPGTTTFILSTPGFATQSQAVTVLPTGFYFDTLKPGTFTVNAFAAANTIGVYLAQLNATTGAVMTVCSNASYCSLNPGAGFTTTLTSSNPTVGTITGGALTFAAGGFYATTAFTPNDIGVSTLSFSGVPAGISTALTGTATVTGYLFAATNVQIGAGTYASFDTKLNTTPPVPLSVTLTVLDNALARLSTDMTVLGASSTITYNNVTCVTSYCSSGGAPLTYVQGTSPGYTKLRLTARGYYPQTITIAVNKLGATLPANQYVIGQVGNTSTSYSIGAFVSLLDPFSNSVVSDCLAPSCLLNPGVAPSFSATPDDPSIITFGASTPFDTATGFMRAPFTPGNAGQTNYSLSPQPAGFYNTSTASRKSGQASVAVSGSAGIQNSLYLVSSDVDAGVGVEVASAYALSGTVLGADSTPVTLTVSDPTVAVLSASTSAAGSGVLTIAGCYCGSGFYVQGLKAGSVTLTIVKSGYLSRTVTVNVRPAGFVVKTFDFTGPSTNRTATVTVNPAVLNAAGQWMANAQLNPGSGTVSVPVTSSNTAIVTTTNATFANNASSGSFTITGGTGTGTTTLTLGVPPALYTVATTYQSVAVTE
jgi:hypothetical protein